MYLAMLGTLEMLIGLVVLLVLGLALRHLGARGWLVLGALMLTCFVTNPDKAKHATAVKDKMVAQEPNAVGRIALDMAGDLWSRYFSTATSASSPSPRRTACS